jgi:transcriptional regulator GlxA family with amidase domain
MDESRYLECLAADHGDLRDAAASVELTTPVPNCPGWTVSDLVFHVAEVYLHKVTVTRTGEWPEQWSPVGLLDDRRCTTHWRNAAELARRYPRAKVDPDVLYVDDDPVITSAGTAAGIDACLYLVRKEQGSRVANGIARRMVVPPHRDGGQAQYVVQPIAPTCDGSLHDLLDWLSAHLYQPLTVRQLAARANMSERTFARRFVADTGTTPQRWLIGQRILLAQQLLEETDETVDAIADRAGFGNATALRHHFRLWRGTTPNAYRRLFRGDPLSLS